MSLKEILFYKFLIILLVKNVTGSPVVIAAANDDDNGAEYSEDDAHLTGVSLEADAFKTRHRRDNEPECFRYNDPDRHDELTQVLSGYDIIKGDPMNWADTSPRDPGFRLQIFQPAVMDEATKKYSLHDGITYSDGTNCNGDVKTEMVTNLRQMQDNMIKSTSSSTSNSFHLESDLGGVVKINPAITTSIVSPALKSGFDVRYAESETLKKLRQSLTDHKESISINTITCTTNIFGLNTFRLPRFNLGFVEAVHQLSKASSNSSSTEEDRQNLFDKFIGEYGTHFIKEASIGAAFWFVRTYKEDLRKKNTFDHAKKCSENSFDFTIINFAHGEKDSECSEEDKRKFSTTSGYLSSEKSISRGSKLMGTNVNVNDWTKQKFDSPVPLTMNHHPIVNLLTDGVLLRQQPDINLNATETKSLRAWFLPKYQQYFDDKINETNLVLPSGCGLDDSCEFNEICRDENVSVCEKPPPKMAKWNECVTDESELYQFDPSSRAGRTFSIGDYYGGSSYRPVRMFHPSGYWASKKGTETFSVGLQLCQPWAMAEVEFKTEYELNLHDLKLFGRLCMVKLKHEEEDQCVYNDEPVSSQWANMDESVTPSCEKELIEIENDGSSFDGESHRFKVKTPKLFYSYTFEMKVTESYATMYNLKIWEKKCDSVGRHSIKADLKTLDIMGCTLSNSTCFPHYQDVNECN